MKPRKSTACTLVAACLAVACGGHVWSQTISLPLRLAHATRLDCRFAVKSTGTWEDGAVSATVEPVDFEASFSNIDIEQGTADADGRFGSSYIVVRYVGDYLHLIHMIDIGTLYVTTVMAEETADGRMMAIHTRHRFAASSYPAFRERPEMYLGDCAVS